MPNQTLKITEVKYNSNKINNLAVYIWFFQLLLTVTFALT